jgi:hypothetical protein
MNHRSILIVLVGPYFAISTALATAASLPRNYLGNWEDITVTEESIDGGAWNCRFNSIIGDGSASSIVIDMSCDMRRGKTWKTHEVWSVQKIGGEEVLIRADSKSIAVYKHQ